MASLPLDLAVIIVTWNVRTLVSAALESLLSDLAQSGLSAGVWVVDSASSDGTVEYIQRNFPTVHVIAETDNRGFGAANNIGLRALGFDGTLPTDQLPRAVYLLNPDTIVHLGSTRSLFDALMDEPKRGLVGAKLSYGDGSFQHAAFQFPGLKQLWVEFFPTPGRLIESGFNGRYPRQLYEESAPFEVDFVLGATMMLRREVIQQTGMFDERYVMYCEEIDWAWRIQRAGWTVACVPAAHVTHLGGQSTGQVRPQSIINLWTSRIRLYEQIHPAWKAALARFLIRVGMRRRIHRAASEAGATSPEISAYNTVSELARRRMTDSNDASDRNRPDTQ